MPNAGGHPMESAGQAPRQDATVAEAATFRAALRCAIPQLPNVNGYDLPENGALIGLGIGDQVQTRVDQLRATIAE